MYHLKCNIQSKSSRQNENTVTQHKIVDCCSDLAEAEICEFIDIKKQFNSETETLQNKNN